MNLCHDALSDLRAPAELISKGGILDRRFSQLKSHVINDHRRVDDSRSEGLRMPRGVFVTVGIGWSGGLITRKRQERTKDVYVRLPCAS